MSPKLQRALPASFYLEPDAHRRERERIFTGSGSAPARADQVERT